MLKNSYFSMFGRSKTVVKLKIFSFDRKAFFNFHKIYSVDQFRCLISNVNYFFKFEFPFSNQINLWTVVNTKVVERY